MTVAQISPQLIALFDLLAGMPKTYHVLWSADHPHAESTLRHWCTVRDIHLEETKNEDGHTLEAMRKHTTIIRVRLDDPEVAMRRLSYVDESRRWRPYP